MKTAKRPLCGFFPLRPDVPLILAASAWLLYRGLNMPILTVRKLWKQNTFSILEGIQALRDDGHLSLAVLVFFFSVIFPIAKLAMLTCAWFVPLGETLRSRVINGLSLLGKWSMLDVFIVAVLIVAVKLGALAEAKPLPGVYYFGASVLLAMLATALVQHLNTKACGLAARKKA